MPPLEKGMKSLS